MVTALDRSGDDSVKSWPFPRSSSAVAAGATPPDGVGAPATPGARPDLNKSLDSAAPARVAAPMSAVRRMAAAFEPVAVAAAAAPPPPSTPGRVAGIVSSLDAQAKTPPSGPKTPAARPVLENSPWKSHGIGSSGGSTSPQRKQQGAAVHRAHLAPVQQRLFETPETARAPSAAPSPPRSDGDARSPSAVAAASPARTAATMDVDPSAAAGAGTTVPGATRATALAARLQGRGQSANLMERIGRFEQPGRGAVAGDPDTSGTSDAAASSTHTTVLEGGGTVTTDAMVSSDAEAVRRGRDPPAISPLKNMGNAATPAGAKVKSTELESTCVMEYSVTPSKILGGDSWLTPSKSGAKETNSGASGPTSDKSIKSTHAMELLGSSASNMGLKQEQHAEHIGYPRRVPVVTLFPRSSSSDVYDLPTTPNRTGDSLDISSLQASPIVQANESFVTLEEPRRATSGSFTGNALQENEDVSESAFGWPSLIPPVASSGQNTEPVALVSQFADSFFGGWGNNLVSNDKATAEKATLMDEFSVKETPRMNNHSFISENSASPSCKEHNQNRGMPPTFPNKLSRASKELSPARKSRAPDLTMSSYDSSCQNEAYSQDQSRPSSEPQASHDLSNGTSSKSTNSNGTYSSASETAERTGSSSDSQFIDSKCVNESTSVPTDTFCSGATIERSSNTYEDCEDIFDGLEVEPSGLHVTQSSTGKTHSGSMNGEHSVIAKTISTAPSQASSTTSATSHRVYENRLRSSLKTIKSREQDQATQNGCQHEAKPSPVTRPSLKAKKPRSTYSAFRIAAANQGFPLRADTLFRHRYADENSTSDDSTCTYSTYTATTIDTPLAPNNNVAGLAQAFFDFLTFGDDESAVTLESESLVTSITGGQRSASSKIQVKKPTESELSLESELNSGPSFAAIFFRDLLKLMDCSADNDDLLRTTEQNLSDEFGISSEAAELEMSVDHDPGIENLVYDVTFFQNLWNEISSQGSENAAWNMGLCGSTGDSDSVADDVYLEDQNVFDALFPSKMASHATRRKAAHVLTLCRKRFPSLYQKLVMQLEKKMRHKKMTPTQRVSSPLSPLPPVKEEGAETEDDDISGGVPSQTVTISGKNGDNSAYMSAPSSTFASELSDDQVVMESSGFNRSALMPNLCVSPSMNNAVQDTATSSLDFSQKYLDASREERLILDYASTEKECKEREGEDYHNGTKVSLTGVNNLMHVQEKPETAASVWHTFTPPRRKNERVLVDKQATQNKDSSRARKLRSEDCEDSLLSSSATLALNLRNVTKPSEDDGSAEELTNQWEAFTFSYFEPSNEEHLVATVKRNNKKLKPSKYDSGRAQGRSKRLHQSSVSTPEPQKSSETMEETSPTAVAPPQIRKLKVADLLYPPSQLDFEKF